MQPDVWLRSLWQDMHNFVKFLRPALWFFFDSFFLLLQDLRPFYEQIEFLYLLHFAYSSDYCCNFHGSFSHLRCAQVLLNPVFIPKQFLSSFRLCVEIFSHPGDCWLSEMEVIVQFHRLVATTPHCLAFISNLPLLIVDRELLFFILTKCLRWLYWRKVVAKSFNSSLIDLSVQY